MKDSVWQSDTPRGPIKVEYTAPSPIWPAIARVAVAAIVALAASIGLYLATRSPHPETHSPTKQIAGTATQTSAGAWEPLTMNPLATEIENLVSDSESAVEFVLACLDVSPIVGDPAPQIE